jgi:ribonucleoside-diphosphate reductase alpha chain
MAKSLVDYIFRWLAMEFVPGYRAANAPQRAKKSAPAPAPAADLSPSPSTPGAGRGEGGSPEANTRTSKKSGNGHGPRIDPDTAQPFAYDDQEIAEAHGNKYTEDATPGGANLRLAIVADPLSRQGTEMQADAPACDVCGSITVRSGTCYKCLNCGNSMGCS